MPQEFLIERVVDEEKQEIIIEEIPEWVKLLRGSIVNAEQLASALSIDIDKSRIREIIKKYPMRINSYYLSLIKEKDDPIWKQCIPDKRELMDMHGVEDPLCEETSSPIPGLIHRYPDRVLLLISNQCAMFCRFCTRKRKVGDPFKRITKEQIMKGIDYIKMHTEVKDVILSGGDPLLLRDNLIEFVLKELRKIPHLKIIRIGTRVPCTLPQRITPELCEILKKYHPLYINVHFNHPREITEEAKKACEMLADTGIPLGNQCVLLKGVNDKPEVMMELVQKLLEIRVKPYYIYQADLVKGTEHFKTKIKVGLDIIKSIRGFTSGMAVPHFVVDLPGGGGKVPLLPEYLIENKDGKITFTNYENKIFTYYDIEDYNDDRFVQKKLKNY